MSFDRGDDDKEEKRTNDQSSSSFSLRRANNKKKSSSDEFFHSTEMLSKTEIKAKDETPSLLIRIQVSCSPSFSPAPVSVVCLSFQLLVNLARNLFREQNDLERLVNKITTESQGLMQCARCCVYIADRSSPTAGTTHQGTVSDETREMSVFTPVIFSSKEIHFCKGFDMIYGEDFKVTT